MIIFQRKKQGDLRQITLLNHTFAYHKQAKLPPHIDKEALTPVIASFKGWGLNDTPRNQKITVSLTSFPERMPEIHFTLYSLLNQSFKPDRIVLWLATEQFPNGEADIPAQVLKLRNSGLTINWCEDLRSYKKLVPSLSAFPDDIIVITDDDIYYPTDWLQKLYIQHQKTPNCIIGHRCHRIMLDKNGQPLPYKRWKHNNTLIKPSYRNLLTGCGGVLYPPHCLHPDIAKVDLFRKLAPYNDDIWFWAMAVLNNVKIRTFWNHHRRVLLVNPEREMRQTDQFTLAKLNVVQDGNTKQMSEMIRYYPELLTKLKEKD
jgi:hypothetical protein